MANDKHYEFDDIQIFVDFSEHLSEYNREDLVSGENLAKSLGKLSKWYAGGKGILPINGANGNFLSHDSMGPKWVAATDIDKYVKQSPVSAIDTNYHSLLIGYPKSSTRGFTPSEITEQAYTTSALYVKPDATNNTATLYATDYIGKINGFSLTGTSGSTYDMDTFITSQFISSITTTGNGNGVTAIGVNNGVMSVTKGSTFALDGHTHPLSIATDTGDSQLSMLANTKYKLTAGGSTFIFTTPQDSDTKVTSSTNHYTPATVSGQDKTASASGATAAWSIDVVKGVTLNTDGKGHVTGISVTSGKIPGNPVPSNNVTGSGTSGYLTKWSGTNTITNGPQLGSSTTTFLRNDGAWATPVDTNYYHKTGTWSGLTYTAAKVGSPEDLTFTIPTGTTSTTVARGDHTHAYTVPVGIVVKTGSSDQSHITLQTLMTWLITTKGYITSNTARSLTLYTSWSYAGNDILQLTIDGTAYELQLAGVIIEFDGYASDYQTGTFRLRIHSSPTLSFTPASGYTQFPASHIAEYTCNGSGYSPTWKMIATTADLSSYIPTSMLTVTKNTNVGITPSSNVFGYVSGLTAAAWNFQQSDGTLFSQYYNDKWQTEIYMDYRTGQMSTRGKNNGTWQDWRIHLDSGNYTSYTVTKTGTGASGTWGISISGSAEKLGTTNKGSPTKGIYLSGGAPQEMTYSLGATVNGGTANQLAYYSGANAISSTTRVTYVNANNSASTPATVAGLHIESPTYGNTAANMIGGVAGVFSYGDGGPQIRFKDASSTQAGALIFTADDAAATGASWHFVSNQTDWNVTSKRFHAKTSISIGTDKPSTSYNLTVNGTSYFDNTITVKGTSSGNASINYASYGNTRNYTSIRFYDGDVNGQGIQVGGGGLTVLGGGESAQAVFDNLSTLGWSASDEVAVIASDGPIYFMSNCDTFANRKSINIDTSGFLNTYYINMDTSNEDTLFSSSSAIVYSNSDKYLRKTSFSKLASLLQTETTVYDGHVIHQNDYNSAGFTRPVHRFIRDLRPNKLAFTLPANIAIEYSTDSGSNWVDFGYTDAEKAGPFLSRHVGGAIAIGPASSAERTTSMQTRITITNDGRDCFIDQFYIWMTTSGHGTALDIQYTTQSAKTTWVNWRTNVELAGWSGPNIINVSELRYGNTLYQIRFIFKITNVRSDYKTSRGTVYDIQAYGGMGCWTDKNNMMKHDSLFTWDYEQKATFPAEVKIPTQLRVYHGNYGTIFRNDGSNTYLLLTDSGSAASGSFNSLRPFSFSNSTGDVTMGHNVNISGTLKMQPLKNIILRDHTTVGVNSYGAGIGYDSKGTECVALWTEQEKTCLRWNAGINMATMTSGAMMDITPDFEISKADGAAKGRIGGNLILHSANYTSYALASSTMYALGSSKGGPAVSANAVNCYSGNEINFSTPDSRYTNIWFGYRWLDQGTATDNGRTIDMYVFGNGAVNGNVNNLADIRAKVVEANAGFTTKNKYTGYKGYDARSVQYAMIYDNGTNLWIGAEQSASYHHYGSTYISTGWTGTLPTDTSQTLTGNPTVKISVPVYYYDSTASTPHWTWKANEYSIIHTGNDTAYLKYRGTASATGEATYWAQIGIKEYSNMYPESVTLQKYAWGAVASLPSSNVRFDLYYTHKSSSSNSSYASNGIQYRTGWTTTKEAWRMLIDNVNYGSYITPAGIGAPTTTGGGASGNWNINITGCSNRATSLDVVAGNEVRFFNDNQFRSSKHFWIGYAWAAGSHYKASDSDPDVVTNTAPTVTQWIFGDCSGTGTNAKVTASGFNGTFLHTKTNPASETLYTIPFVYTDSSDYFWLRYNDGIGYRTAEGTTSTSSAGFGLLCLGNTVPIGTAGNKSGLIRLYTDVAKSGTTYSSYVQISAPSLTDTRYLYCPNKTGTIAVTTDIIDENVKQVAVTPSSAIVRAVLFSDSANTNTSSVSKFYNAFRLTLLNGSSSEEGRAELDIGNPTKTGTAGNITGWIQMYSAGSAGAKIKSATQDAWSIFEFPAKGDGTYTLATTEDATWFLGNLRDTLGANTPAAATKTYFDSTVPSLRVSTAYNNNGDEYTLIFGKGSGNSYGTILRWGYSTKYLEILRKQTNAWKSDDWEKISAGCADCDESGNNIKATYAASFSISDHTITLKNKNGTSLGTVTVPDNNTTYGISGAYDGNTWKTTLTAGGTGTTSIVPTASTSAYGITKLYNGVDSTSTGLAATANAVKTAYDKGNHSHPYLSNTTKYALSSSVGGIALSSYAGTLTHTDEFNFNERSASGQIWFGYRWRNADGSETQGETAGGITGNDKYITTYRFGNASGVAKYANIAFSDTMEMHSGSYTTTITNSSITANRTITIPNASGTISLEGHTHSYAGSTTAGGSATSSDVLNKNNTAGATTTGLQYYSGGLTKGTADGNAASGSNASYKLWSYPPEGTYETSTAANVQGIRMYWNTSYFKDIFLSPNSFDIYHRSVYNGTAKPWCLILDSMNFEGAQTSPEFGWDVYTGKFMGPATRPMNSFNRANKLAFIPAANISIEYSTNGGSSWANMETAVSGTNDAITTTDKANIFSGQINSNIRIGPNSTNSRTTSMQTRVTITNDGRDCYLDQFQFQLNTGYHKFSIEVQVSLTSAPDTFYTLRNSIELGTWTYQAIINVPWSITISNTKYDVRFGSSIKKIRFIFRQTWVNSSYLSSVSTISMVSGHSGIYWGATAGSYLAKNDHLYTWNAAQEATFPSKVNFAGGTTTGIITIGSPTSYVDGLLIHTSSSNNNYVRLAKWSYGGTLGTYGAEIGYEKEGSGTTPTDGAGKIVILPYQTSTTPWSGNVGLVVKKQHVYIDGVELTQTGNVVPFLGNLTSMGSSSVANSAKTFWESANCPSGPMLSCGYNSSGTEYSFIFSKQVSGSASWGSILRWTYDNTYLEILRHQGASWKSDNWEKISAGKADTWTTARTLTIGNTGKSVDGSGNVSWSLAEIGALSSTTPYAYSSSVGGGAAEMITRLENGADATGSTKFAIWFGATIDSAADASNYARRNGNATLTFSNGTTTAGGWTRLTLGNNKATGTAGNMKSEIWLYSANTSYHSIEPASTTSAITHTLPAKTGTILNTGTTSFTRTLNTGTRIGTLTINDSAVDLFCETNSDVNVTQTVSGSNYTSLRPLLVGNSYFEAGGSPSTVTSTAVATHKLYVKPSDGILYLDRLIAYDSSTAISCEGNLRFANGKNAGIILRDNATWASGITYDTKGQECIAMWAKMATTSLKWKSGLDLTTMTAGKMHDTTPDFAVTRLMDGSSSAGDATMIKLAKQTSTPSVATITTANLTANRTIYLPNSSGTIGVINSLYDNTSGTTSLSITDSSQYLYYIVTIKSDTIGGNLYFGPLTVIVWKNHVTTGASQTYNSFTITTTNEVGVGPSSGTYYTWGGYISCVYDSSDGKTTLVPYTAGAGISYTSNSVSAVAKGSLVGTLTMKITKVIGVSI